MAQRALNRVQLIGNLTRDPELRYTPKGTAVCTFGLATNRTWTTDTGEKRDQAEFHRLVAWNKLAEICSQLLFKGRRVYLDGRLQTRQWTGKDGVDRQTTEIVVSDMIILDSKRTPGEIEEPISEEPVAEKSQPMAHPVAAAQAADDQAGDDKKAKAKKPAAKSAKKKDEDKVEPEDIPF